MSNLLPAQPMRRQTLADRLAEDIAERILSSTLKPGDALPAGPELARQYGVSRAVVRDATSLLAARGLVDVRHGSGVYVTSSQYDAFGDALLLTLRRADATAWDLEEFEQFLIPAAAAMVCANASADEIASIRELANRHLAVMEKQVADEGTVDGTGSDDIMLPFARVLRAVFQATHNEVVRQIGTQLAALRRPRNWVGISDHEALALDRKFLSEFLSILESHDPTTARRKTEALMQLPQEAVDALKHTPIGDVPRIDLGSDIDRFRSSRVPHAADGS
jgi:GntR family transcriptional regulator, transcriptional repressor for pyruvate dehydrogenase complex